MRNLRYIGLCCLILLLPLLAALPQCSSTASPPPLPAWPDASKYWGAIVNANDAIGWYLQHEASWFAEDRLLTDTHVGSVDYTSPTAIPTASVAWNQMYAALTARGIMPGTYTSGTNVEPMASQNSYPMSMVMTEDMPSNAVYLGTWPPGSPYCCARQFIDPHDLTTAAALHNQIAALWRQTTVPFRFVDNSASLEGGSYGTWSDQMANLSAINRIAQSQGSRAIFNMSIIVGNISQANMSLLLSSVAGGGICLEEPWASSISGSPSATAQAVAQYRQILDSGIAIVMIGSSSTTEATNAQLRAWVATWRKPTDHLYLSKSFFNPPNPTVYDWP